MIPQLTSPGHTADALPRAVTPALPVIARRRRSRGSQVFAVGAPAQLADLSAEIDRTRDVTLAGTWSTDHRGGADPEALLAAVRAAGAHTLVLTDDALGDEQLVTAASVVNRAGVRVRPLSTFYEHQFGKVALGELSPAWFLFDIAEIHRRRLYGLVKRAAEVVLAAALLVATAPILPLIALLIWRASPGPVLFTQERVGRAGQRFRLIKFRTMHRDPEREHGTWAAANGSRIFAAGAFLRRTRLDELPQLWNVIRGDLSIVGPRPEQPAIVDRLCDEIPFYAERQTVRPGLTGWAQVRYGYGGSVPGTRAKLQYDLYYIKRQSLKLDLSILAATAVTMLRASGS
jgi:lipopolysaccharide/colanic/teichoic acid biosynthesis glycosyltransferase